MSKSRSDRWAVAAAFVAFAGGVLTFAGVSELTSGPGYIVPAWTKPVFVVGLSLLVVAAVLGLRAVLVSRRGTPTTRP